ncbi:MAG: MCE family protein [Burkholderiales bacterium]|nr:MCE family protein [Burkholderiales bacterium]
MEAEARYTFVGAVVLLLVAALVGSVVWLKHAGGKNDFNRYAIYFERQSLDGLDVGADVNLRGIKVGRVEDYALAREKLNRVRVDIRVDRRVPVTTNTVAVVTRNFVTGIAAITLVTREPAGPPLTEVTDNERYPVIHEGRSDLDEIAGRVNQVGEAAAGALNNINQLLTAENREATMATIRAMRELMQGLSKRLGALDQALRQVGSAATEVGSAATRVGEAGDRIATAGERSAERLDKTLAEAERTLADARRALAQVASATDAVQTQALATARRLEQSAATVDDQLDAAVGELRLSVEAATRVLDRLRDPRAALLGPGKQQLGPGEGKP